MTFFVQTSEDQTYTKIMEILISRSLSHCKDHVGGILKIEIEGSPIDYKILSDIIDEANLERGGTVASITEGI